MSKYKLSKNNGEKIEDNKNKQPDEERTNNYLSMGIAIGMGLGVAYGTVFDNLALGISLGMCFGISIGGILSARKKDGDK